MHRDTKTLQSPAVSNGYTLKRHTGLTHNFLAFRHSGVECLNAKNTNNGGLDQYGAERFGGTYFCHNQKRCGTESVKITLLQDVFTMPVSTLVVNILFGWYLGPVSPTRVNFNRRFSPHFNLQLA